MSDVTNMKPAEAEERAHHPYSPSTLQNREACPCYESRSEANEKAILGTLQHSMTESREDDMRLSDDEALAAAECLDFYDRQKTLMLEERDRATATAIAALPEHEHGHVELPLPLELVEEYLAVDDCNFTEDLIQPDGSVKRRTFDGTTAGYVDRAIISWDRLRAIMVDWKFGAWAVEQADNNLQGIAYALGLFRRYPTLNTIVFYFKQPHINRLSHATFTRDQVPKLYLRIQTTVARSMEAKQRVLRGDFSMANPMVPACNFCANIGRCDKVTGFACSIGSKFFPLEIPADVTPTGLKTSKDTALGLRMSQVMAVWAAAFKRCVTERVLRREAPLPEGYVLQTRSDRSIVDTKKFRSTTLQYLTEAELAELAEYGFKKVEELIKTKAPRGAKKGTIEAYQQALVDAGAVARDEPYTFMRIASGKDNTE